MADEVDYEELLTPREIEIVEEILTGQPNKVIAVKFAISEETVKRHLMNIYDKVGCSTRLELAVMVIQNRRLVSGLMDAYECGLCGKDIVIRDPKQSPVKLTFRVGGSTRKLNHACPDCAVRVSAALERSKAAQQVSA